MSNTEFVMVPRDLMERCRQFTLDIKSPVCLRIDIEEALANPAQQHQGEPVALPERKAPTQHWAEPGGVHKAEGWNACLDEIARLGPLYAHTDPGEVERLRAEIEEWNRIFDMQEAKIDALRAQLAEAVSVLTIINRKATEYACTSTPTGRECRFGDEIAAISASAEPNQCDGCQAGIPAINGAHRMGKPGGYADTMSCQAGRYASAEPSAMAERIKSAVCPKCSSHPCACEELTAPVERDERADFDAWTVRKGRVVGYCGWREDFAVWQARAALERKP